jgi:hypothetical protein
MGHVSYKASSKLCAYYTLATLALQSMVSIFPSVPKFKLLEFNSDMDVSLGDHTNV